ncbi:CHAP domain-containing protein [Novosphingobium sp. BL-8H]|uniref:CHAP domain-containing protein n=1 Tax=Novosphingobium sp. BL-8H TaxID=3127640 RepID=UPI0037575872
MNNTINTPANTSARSFVRRALLALAATVSLTGGFSAQALASPLQCVPYARDHSGIDIHGNAWTWWDKARGIYARGNAPKIGAVLAMAPSQAMPLGHVAVVEKIVDSRHILLDHANWSSPGRIERGALAEDVSAAGDWSEVRVWYAPSGGLGSRTNPVFGFIYAEAGTTDTGSTETVIAAASDEDDSSAG